MIITSKDINLNVIKLIKKLYFQNVILHAYLFYDLIYYPEVIDIYLNIYGSDIIGYILIWKGFKCCDIRIVGKFNDLIEEYLPTCNCYWIHLVGSSTNFVNVILKKFNKLGRIDVKNYLNMIVSKEFFKPYYPEKAIKLNIEHIDQFLDIKREQGREIDYSEAILRLSSPHWHYYGYFINGKLISIASTYLKLPEIWIIGDVYTRVNYRNKGYGKIVTSAVTKDALNSGAIALLHVEENNLPAIKLYQKIGFKVIGVEKWIYIEV